MLFFKIMFFVFLPFLAFFVALTFDAAMDMGDKEKAKTAAGKFGAGLVFIFVICVLGAGCAQLAWG